MLQLWGVYGGGGGGDLAQPLPPQGQEGGHEAGRGAC